MEPFQKPGGWKEKLGRHWPPTRRQALIFMGVFTLLAGGATTAAILLQPEPKPVAKQVAVKPVPPPTPTVVPSTLSGLPVAPDINDRPVTGIMIENSTFARPQSGLKDASVIFEAVAEGGITRFLALYQDTQPTNVGPVRSARPYYAQWAMGFDAGYAHVGGSPQALQNIKEWGVKDLDQFHNANAYRRISSRSAPHNMYTGVDVLTQLQQAKGFAKSTYTGFTRKAKEAPAQIPTAKGIQLQISGPLYNAQYDYDAPTNSYKRSMGGAAHTDADSGVQLTPKVVVAMVMQQTLDGKYSVYNVIGSGKAYVFQDGVVTTGQWSKTANTAQITFTDDNGQPLLLNPGQTWLTAVGTPGAVTYRP